MASSRTPTSYDGTPAYGENYGVVRYATPREVLAGTETRAVVSPADLQAATGAGLSSPTPIGDVTPNTGAFTTLSSTGPITAGTTLTATLGDITATDGNLSLGTAGNKLLINAATPTASSVGTTDPMVAGAVTITSSAITANSLIIYSRRTLGTAAGFVSITAQVAGSATLTSDDNTETSTFDYLIIN